MNLCRDLGIRGTCHCLALKQCMFRDCYQYWFFVCCMKKHAVLAV